MITFPTSREGQLLGELTPDEIEQALRKGSLRQNDYVYNHQTEEWVPVYVAFEITEELLQTIESNSRPMSKGMLNKPEMTQAQGPITAPMAKTAIFELPDLDNEPDMTARPMAKTALIDIPDMQFMPDAAARPMAKTALIQLPEMDMTVPSPVTRPIAKAITKEMAKTMIIDLDGDSEPAAAAVEMAQFASAKYVPQGGTTTSLISKPKSLPMTGAVPRSGPMKKSADVVMPGGSVTKPLKLRAPVSAPMPAPPAAIPATHATTGIAAGWIMLTVLAVAGLMWMLVGLSSMLTIRETEQMKTDDINSAVPSLVAAKKIMLALHAYAASHSGVLPRELADLGGQTGMPDLKDYEFIPRGGSGKPGFSYPGAGVRMDAPPETVVLKTKWLTAGKRAVVGHLDGSVEVLKVE
jgi:hypothetical protein